MRRCLEATGTIDVVAEAGDGQALLQQVTALSPDVAVVDLAMPGLNGINAARSIRSHQPHTRVLIVSLHCTEATVSDAIDAGASGYVLKEAAIDELVKAVLAVADGNAFFSPLVAKLLVSRLAEQGTGKAKQRLTEREREVVQLITEGDPTRAIAARLFISLETVKSHRANAMRKLGCRSTADLVRFAIVHGLVST